MYRILSPKLASTFSITSKITDESNTSSKIVDLLNSCVSILPFFLGVYSSLENFTISGKIYFRNKPITIPELKCTI